jgi:hypothetical protein
MSVQNQISGVVATQIGTLQGQLEARVQTEALRLLDKFTNQCPNQDELLKVVQVRNNLVKVVNSFQKKTDKFNRIANSLRPPITIAKILINLLKRNPTPTAIGTPPGPSGGLITAQTAGKLTTLADRLANTRRLLEFLEGDIASIEEITGGISNSLIGVSELLNSVNISINECASQLGADELKELLTATIPLVNTGSEGIPNENFIYRGANGRIYTLGIIQEQQGEGPIPRRVAVAKDNIGVIILRGQPSFSSDTKILLDELKFRIDNQLP